MSTPKHEQVWDALKVLFASIEGDQGETYWYTVEKVIDWVGFDSKCLNTSHDTVYCLSPDVSEVDPFTFTGTRVSALIKLSMARRFAPVLEDPFDPSDQTRLQIQNRLIQDATKKLNSAASSTRPNWTLEGLALRAGIIAEDRSADETYYEGWAIAHLMLRVEYVYEDDDP